MGLREGRRLRYERWKFVFGFARADSVAEPAVTNAAEKVNQQSEHEPDEEPDPRLDRQAQLAEVTSTR